MGETRNYSDVLRSEALKMIIKQGMIHNEVRELLGYPREPSVVGYLEPKGNMMTYPKGALQ